MDRFLCAKKIVKKLVDEGFVAYFAGGWVRDYLIGHPSLDIDIATNAPPEKILKLFPRTVPIGLAFGVVLVVIKPYQFEVSTFRKDLSYRDGRRPEAIAFSSAKEDALRRDFTINGMFYDPLKEKIHDFIGGKKDLEKKRIRTIGDPDQRFEEDRLRMIRAVRLANRFGFSLDLKAKRAIKNNAEHLFPAVAIERVYDELKKMSSSPNFGKALLDLYDLKLLGVIFPSLKKKKRQEIKHFISFYSRFSRNTPTILYLAFLFPGALQEELCQLCQYLKTSRDELKIIKTFGEAKEKLLRKETVPLNEWAHFYALPDGKLCIEIASFGYPEKKRALFLKKQKTIRDKLSRHILRIVKKKPLIDAETLKKEGIHPGKNMGNLLREAEKLAIIHDLHNKGKVLSLLKKSTLWQKIKDSIK